DRDGSRVVQQLDPADDEPDRRVEGPAREARAAAGVRQRGSALGVVEGGGDEDETGEDERERRQPEGEGRGDAERVVDARPDVAVTRREEGAGAQRPGSLAGRRTTIRRSPSLLPRRATDSPIGRKV